MANHHNGRVRTFLRTQLASHRSLPLNGLLIAVLWPWFVWLGGWRRDEIIIAVAFGTAIFAVCGAFVVDGELRREVPLGRLLVIPVVVGLWFLSPLMAFSIYAAAGLVVVALTSRRMAKEFVATFAIATGGAALLAAVLRVGGVVDRPDATRWMFVIGACIVIDAVATYVDSLVRSTRQPRRRQLLRRELLSEAVQVIVQCALALTLIELIAQNAASAVLVFVAAVGTFAVIRRGLTVTVRNRQLDRLNQLAMRLTKLISDVAVFREILDETTEATETRQAWIIMVREGASVRYERVDRDLIEGPISELDHQLTRNVADGECKLIDSIDPGIHVTLRKALTRLGYPELIVASLNGPQNSRFFLVVADRGDEYGRFDHEDVHLVEAIATHGQLAMFNVDLFDQVRQKAAEQEYLATHDQLTGLPNRTMIHGALRVAIEDPRPTAVLLLDLDRFREINDTLGHTYGDLVLLEVSRRLTRLLHDDEFVARLGGDEWAIIWRPQSPIGPEQVAGEATMMAERIVRSLHQPFHIDDINIDIRGSVGVAIAGPDAPDPVTLLRHADVAMYLAKRTKSHIEIYRHERDHHSPRRLALVGRLRTAIDNRALHLQYQPQVHLSDSSPCGVEALIRWRQSDGSIVAPYEFIAVAEHTGLIHNLTHLVISEAVEYAARWWREGTPIRVSMNLSAHNLADDSIVAHFAETIEHYRIPPDLLLVKLTESAVIDDEDNGIDMMRRLRNLGLGIAIDDFGTGQSSLSYLTKLPATELKIDRSFIQPMTSDRAAEIVVRSTISLAHSLGMSVVAEGVETVEQRNMLRAMGCDVAQGYLYARPLEARGLELWLEEWQAHSQRRPNTAPPQRHDLARPGFAPGRDGQRRR